MNGAKGMRPEMARRAQEQKLVQEPRQPSAEELAEAARLNALIDGQTATVYDATNTVIARGHVKQGAYKLAGNNQYVLVESDEEMNFIMPNRITQIMYKKNAPAPAEETPEQPNEAQS